MNDRRQIMRVIKTSYFSGLLALIFQFVAYEANSAIFSPDNLLVQSQTPGVMVYNIREYDLIGNEIQALPVPQPPGQTEYIHPRDLSFDINDSLHLYNGTFEPYLSSYNLLYESWEHTTISEWNTINNGSYGGLATYSNHVFVTDMTILGDASGIVAFDTVGGSATRFATDIEPIDLNIGLDGQLYALSGYNYTVSIYDPKTFAFKGSVILSGGGDIRTIAVDRAGNIYAASWGGTLTKYSSSGEILDTIATTGSAIDLDISGDGILAIGTRLNGIFITDTDFSTSSSFDNGDWNSFVTFIPSPVTFIEVDIKPYGESNNINPSSRGLIPVAILTSDTFDALQVDPDTVSFGPDGATDPHGRAHVKDIDNDGDADLLFHFRSRETGISCGDTEATLSGQTWDGTPISGTDLIQTVGRSCR